MGSLTNEFAGQFGLALLTLAVVVGVAIFIVTKFRDRVGLDRGITSDMLMNFEEMHSQGELSEREYRNIKTLLKERLENELQQSRATRVSKQHQENFSAHQPLPMFRDGK
jgi:hypothetical protein